MNSKLCFILKPDNIDCQKYEKNINNIKKVLPGFTFLDIVINDAEITPKFLQQLKLVDNIEEYKKLNYSKEQMKFFLSQKKIWGTILNNNIPDALVIDISAAPINPNKEINISKILTGLPDFYGYVNLYDINCKNAMHNKCNTNFNYMLNPTKNTMKAYYITNDFCKLIAKYIKKMRDLPKYLIELSVIFKNCYSMKHPLFNKYIENNDDKNIKPSLPVKEININDDRFYIIKDSETTYLKNITDYKNLYKNSYMVSSLKEGLIEIIKSNKGGFIVNSNEAPLFNILDNIPKYVPEKMQYLTWIKKNDNKKIIFNNELHYVKYDMPNLNTFYVTPDGAILLLMIITKEKSAEMNSILSRERVAFVYSVDY